jgi:plasmid stabilization system protein ParE
MTAAILNEAEEDLEQAFDYYQGRRRGLGIEFVEEFRRGVARVLEHPNAWQALDAIYRRYRLHRFPYGIVYRVDWETQRVIIVTVMDMSRRPGWWRDREK